MRQLSLALCSLTVLMVFGCEDQPHRSGPEASRSDAKASQTTSKAIKTAPERVNQGKEAPKLGKKAHSKPSKASDNATEGQKPDSEGLEPIRKTLNVLEALSIKDIKSTLGFDGALVPADLQGIPASPTYGKVRLRPEAPKDHFGVALQVWRGSPEGASDRFGMFTKTYKNPRLTREIGDKSMRDKRGKIHNLTWLSGRRGEVIALTCDERLCETKAMLKLAQRIEVRLAALP